MEKSVSKICVYNTLKLSVKSNLSEDGGGWTGYYLNFTSQRWLTPEQVENVQSIHFKKFRCHTLNGGTCWW